VEIFSFYSLLSSRHDFYSLLGSLPYAYNIKADLCIVSKRTAVEKKDPVKGIGSWHKMKKRELLHHLI
jgi:hypothetical protein